MGTDGTLMIADGPFFYGLKPGSPRQTLGFLFMPGCPGYTRGVAVSGPGEVIVTTAFGQVARWWPAKQESAILAEGYDQLYGVAVAQDGAIVFAELGTGRVLSAKSDIVEVLATGLNRPKGVAIAGDGSVLVSEEGAGRVVKLSGGHAETVLDGLKQPQGLLVRGSLLYIVDALAKELIEVDMAKGARSTIVSKLPVGAPPGVVPKFLGAIGNLSGPMGPFSDSRPAPTARSTFRPTPKAASWRSVAPEGQEGRLRHAQADLLLPQAARYDHGRIHGLLREPAFPAVEEDGPRTLHRRCAALCAPLHPAGEEPGDGEDRSRLPLHHGNMVEQPRGFRRIQKRIADPERLPSIKADEKKLFATHDNPVYSVIEYDSPMGRTAKRPKW